MREALTLGEVAKTLARGDQTGIPPQLEGLIVMEGTYEKLPVLHGFSRLPACRQPGFPRMARTRTCPLAVAQIAAAELANS